MRLARDTPTSVYMMKFIAIRNGPFALPTSFNVLAHAQKDDSVSVFKILYAVFCPIKSSPIFATHPHEKALRAMG